MNSITLQFYNNTKRIISIFKISNKIPIIVLLVVFSTLLELLGIGILIPISSIIFQSDSAINDKIISILPAYFEKQNSLEIFLYAFLIIFIIKNIILIFIEYYKADYFHSIYLKMVNNFYIFYLNTPLKFFFKKNSSKIVDIVITRVEKYIGSLLAFTNLISELILTLGIFLLLLSISSLSAIILILALMMFLALYLKVLKKKLMKFGWVRDENQGTYIKHLNESLNFIREINIFKLKKYFQDQGNILSNKFVFAKQNITFITSIGRNFFEIVAIICIFSFLIFLNHKENSIIDILPIITIYMAGALKILPSINRISNGVQNINVNFNISKTIIDEIVSLEKNQLNFNEKLNKNFQFNNQIEIKNLEYFYNDTSKVFKNFNLTIKKGECVAIVGKSGSGKSTLLEIICGFLEPSNGLVLIDNENLSEYRNDWMKMIGYVTQETFILDDSLKKNVAISDLENEKIDEKRVIEILKTINLYNFFIDKKDGINTILHERGKSLSGGQKQRINIARNLYKKPKVIFFDEPTSALDHKTSEDMIIELKKIKKYSTMIIVTHDIKIMNFCDRVVNLDEINARI